MKILYLHQYFNTPEMSGGTRSFEMAKRFVQAGHQVDMITSQRDPDSSSNKEWTKTKEAGIKVHWYPIPYSNKMSYTQCMYALLIFGWVAARKATRLDSDEVFATSTPLTIALSSVYA